MIPVSIFNKDSTTNNNTGKMRIIISDKQSGYSCSINANYPKVSRNKTDKSMNIFQQLQSHFLFYQYLIFCNKYTDFTSYHTLVNNNYD
jgi:hypothetical protein